jgi:hypothetical protein
MPAQAEREMIADWMGAGRAINGTWDATIWYAKNKDKIHLHPATRARVEEQLNKKIMPL